jgi:hypothetical protein
MDESTAMIQSFILVVLCIGVPAMAAVLDRWLKFYWKDARTRKHRLVRRWLIGLSSFAVIAGCLVAIVDRWRAEKQSQRLAQALKDAEHERKAHAFAGRFELQEGLGCVYVIGDSGAVFVRARTESLLEGIVPASMRKIAEQNSVVSKTVAGKLLVSAKIQGRDGLLAEIRDNEWQVNPPPKSWDRNYSTNALEVKDADGNIVFQIKLRAGGAGVSGGTVVLSFQGIFFDSDGNGVALTANNGGRGAWLTVLPKNAAVSIPVIQPLFEYPSSLHLGGLADRN